ncbi:MAG: hypothetical protein K0Q72_2834 [Armatimonadetes bacterium]|jgi:outer membrane protein assembly factor BamB|nr:hypothetical protein [Armatimonadota bacterium]
MIDRRTFLAGGGALLAAPVLAAPAAPVGKGDQDWPQYRGPGRDGVWRETGVIERFTGPEIPVKWRAPVSNGYSGPTVAAGRVYVTDRVTEPEQQERVHCFDWKTGDKLWSYGYACKYAGFAYPNGPRASVTVQQGRAFTVGSMGHVHAFDAVSGKLLWGHDCFTEYGIRVPDFGVAADPLLDEDRVVVHIGGSDGACLVAFDQKTGKERWRSLEDRAGYASPVAIRQAGKPLLVVWTGERIAGLDPRSGRPIWSFPFKSPAVLDAITSPVIDGERLFVSGWHSGALQLRLLKERPEVEKVWHLQGPNERNTQAFHTMFTAPMFGGNELYGIDTYGELRCLDVKTGERIWSSEAVGPHVRNLGVHFTRHGGEVWIFNEKGELIIARLSRQGYQELSRAQLIRPTRGQFTRRGEGVAWAPPAFAYRHVFARNDEELICASLAA